MESHEELTQKYSTWGDKLLQHTEVLWNIQHNKKITPITIQLAPTETCNSDCPFCSVAGRPLKSFLKFEKIKKLLKDFKDLGAKSVEITGGGNPLLYRDKDSGETINDVISYANSLGFQIGIITNSSNLKILKKEVHDHISWIRVSLIQLDEGVNPEDYNFNGFPYQKLAFSYIIYETGGTADPLSRTNKVYQGTTPETIERIAKLVSLHPEIKFVRIAGNCLIKGNNKNVKDKFYDIVSKVDKYNKFFIKDIDVNDDAYKYGCYVGGVRPYIAPSPLGGDYQVYICTSHVLNHRCYDLNYSLGSVDNVLHIWDNMNKSLKEKNYPYEIKCNSGKDWDKSCKYCYYKFNNKLLHTVNSDLPDRNFP